MLDLTNPRDRRALGEAMGYAGKMQGLNFCLVMRNPDGNLTLYPRENQPCQGGEMRKYESSHPGDCTRPQDCRPTDLHHPFPDGTPEAVAVKFNTLNPFPEELFRQIVGTASPYRNAGCWGKVWPISHKRFDNWIQGAVFTNTEVDPTLFVNMLQFINTVSYNTWDFLMESAVFEYGEVVPIMMLTNPAWMVGTVPTPYSYYFPVNSAIHRIMEGNPHDLTGGTFRNRFDYNRPEIQDLFKAKDGETSTNFCKELSSRKLHTQVGPSVEFPYGRIVSDSKEVLQSCKEILNNALEKERKRISASI